VFDLSKKSYGWVIAWRVPKVHGSRLIQLVVLNPPPNTLTNQTLKLTDIL